MQPRYLTFTILPLLFIACLVFGLQATAQEEDTAMNSENNIPSSEDYRQTVEKAGGRVDFLFEDDRPFQECHASSIVQAANGDLLAAWFAGTKEKDPDVGVWWSRFTDGAWSAPIRIAKVSETAHWNPVLFRDAEDDIYLFFKVGVDVPEWSTWWMQSEDHGHTWNDPVELVPGDVGGRGPVKNKPIILADGTWLAPASTEEKGRFGAWKPFADISTDRGKTWERTDDWPVDKEVLKGLGAIQPTFWESEPGTVHALMRTTIGKVWRTDSKDGGRTWDPVYATDLPNNNSGLDVLLLEDGRLLMIYNPVGINWGPRTPLDLAVSKDNGQTWRTIAHIEDNPDPKSEFSYPAIIRTSDGIAISYTWHRQRVRCWQIPLAAL